MILRFCHPVLVLLLAGLGANEPLPDGDRLVEEFRSIAVRRHYEARPLQKAFNEILASVSAGEGFGGTAERLQRALGISAEAAVPLARGVLRELVLTQRTLGTGNRDVTPEMVSSIEADLRQAVDRARCNRAVLQALADFFNESRGRPGASKDYGSTLAQSVRPCPDSARTAEAIAVSHTGDDELLAALFPIAAAANPDHPAILHWMASRLYGSLARAPLSHAAFQALAKLPGTVDPRIALNLAEQEIDADLEAGLSGEAAAVYSSLPSSIQKGILEASSSLRFDAELDGFAYPGWLMDLRLPLAAAFLLEGDGARARVFLDSVTRRPPAQPGRDRTVSRLEAVLSEFRAPVSGDRFDLISEAMAEDEMRRTLWSRVLARVALGADYPRVAVESLENAIERVGWNERLRSPDFIVIPSHVRTLSERFRGLLERLSARLTGELAEARRRLSEPVATDTMKPVMQRLLESAPWNPYVERPLPGGIEPVEISRDDAWKKLRDLATQLHLPPNTTLIRSDARGAEIHAIVQPRLSYGGTDFGGNGNWWIHSSDTGRTWSEPLYLGLRGGRYAIRGFSNLPLVENGRIQIEVEIWEKDPNVVLLGPGTPRRKAADGVYLEAPLAAISQDSDGDGLTDLLEDALFLDPQRSDTDGDGFGDAEDLMPNVTFTRASSAESRALAAFVEHMVGWSHRLILPLRRAPPPEEPLPDPSVLLRRMFVFVGNRSWFSGIEPTARLVVLTPEEWKSAGSRQEGVLPVFIHSFLLSKDRTRGVLRWSANSEWGTARLEVSANGEWTAVDIARAIS
jgi:hypothetical protein